MDCQNNECVYYNDRAAMNCNMDFVASLDNCAAYKSLTTKEAEESGPFSEGLGKQLAEWHDSGWRIERTSCSCGGNWAWLKETDRGTLKMYGCVCHHIPDEKFA